MKFSTTLFIAFGSAVVTNIVCNAISYFHTEKLDFSLYGWVCLAVATMAIGGTPSASDAEETRKEAKKQAELTFASLNETSDDRTCHYGHDHF